MSTIDWELTHNSPRETQWELATINRVACTALRRHLLRIATVALLVLLAAGHLQMSAPFAAFNGVTTPAFLAHAGGGGNPPPLGVCGGGAGLPC